MAARVEAGRPRNEQATQRVLQAALDAAYSGGAQFATVERISRETGIAKSTIYRRWPNASAIIMDAFIEEINPLIQYQNEGSITEIFVNTIISFANSLKGKRGKLLTELFGLAQFDCELKAAFLERWIEPRRREGVKVLQNAVSTGHLEPDIDPQLILDLLYGAVYYRLGVSFKEIDNEFAEKLVTRTFCGLSRTTPHNQAQNHNRQDC